MFPMQIHTHQADPRLNPAHNYFQYDIASVKMNVPVETDARAGRNPHGRQAAGESPERAACGRCVAAGGRIPSQLAG